jgi:hypothetical protein
MSVSTGGLALLVVSACTQGALKMNPTPSPIARLVEDIAQRLGAPDASAPSLSRLLGPVREKFTGSGYDLAPVDSRLTKVWIGVSQDATGSEIPTDVEVELASVPGLSLDDLDRVLGSHHDLPPAPNGPLHKIAYERDLGSNAFKVTLFATLSGPADRPGAMVRGLLIRRDKR